MVESTTFFVPSALLVDSVLPVRSLSSNFCIFKLAKVGSLVGLDDPASTMSPGPVDSRVVIAGRGGSGVDIAVSSGVIAIGGDAAGGMGGMGWDLGREVVDVVEGGTGVCLPRPAVDGGIHKGGRLTGRYNAAPDEDGIERSVRVEIGVGVGSSLVSTGSTSNPHPYSHSARLSSSNNLACPPFPPPLPSPLHPPRITPLYPAPLPPLAYRALFDYLLPSPP